MLCHNYLREGQCKVDLASVCLCFELEAVFGFLSVAWKGVGGTFTMLFSFHPVVLCFCFCFLKTITSFWLGVVCVWYRVKINRSLAKVLYRGKKYF